MEAIDRQWCKWTAAVGTCLGLSVRVLVADRGPLQWAHSAVKSCCEPPPFPPPSDRFVKPVGRRAVAAAEAAVAAADFGAAAAAIAWKAIPRLS